MAKQQLDNTRNWYVVHTYAGYENAVMRNLKQRIESLGMEDKIFNVIVPTEKKIKIKGGKSEIGNITNPAARSTDPMILLKRFIDSMGTFVTM